MSAFNEKDAFVSEHGFVAEDNDGTRHAGYFSGSGAPSGSPGTPAPLGSLYIDASTGLHYVKTGAGDTDWSSQAPHENLDTLTHGIAENSFREITYTAERVDKETIWTDSGKTKKIRETTYTYSPPSSSFISQIVTVQYDSSGAAVAGTGTITETFNYSGNKIVDSTMVKS